ncbi:MAG: Ycf51 family protein [Oscillatoriaceae bacterium SKW80]|nr:Ycf51 family protein [Oscillatoriaceae bacterium SKYG93]MCX8121045.1 Ycf51 family protein [Oscillatoriaceae bacterium SKW80]MDW8452318.1 Ycf51 family protein [Oscillatoriaceae cyanobacterium SKYGB_i_bin93]HIK26652.1 Ycf51 family protein [Oscillatoriaceae cyanobacterium M7585_C2015_266]
MLTTANFMTAAKWAGMITVASALIAVLGFILQWGIRFRLVGITGFMAVLTGGLFALGLVPFTRTVIPGAVRYTTVYDTGSTQAVIAVAPTITETELEATLRQAASNLFSLGRLGRRDDKLTIRARTIIHPQPGVSKLLYLGQVQRSLRKRQDEQMVIEIFPEQLAQLPKPSA